MKSILFPKSTLALAALLAAMGGNANAGAGVMLGISHNFGGETGITLKVLSTDRKDKFAGAVGVSYFPWAPTRSWGIDTSVGYTFRHGAVTMGYDWLNSQVQVGLGAVNTKGKKAPPPPPPVAVAAPAPVPEAAPAPTPEPVAAPAPVPEAAPSPAPAPEVAPPPPPPPPVDDSGESGSGAPI